MGSKRPKPCCLHQPRTGGLVNLTLRTLVGYVLGTVRVQVKGKNPERLVNLCVCSGFPVWDIARSGKRLYFTTTLASYWQIRPLARRSMCIPRVVKRTGIPFILGRIKRRPVFVSVSILLLMAFFCLSGSVWAISVKGNVKVTRSDILRVASEKGLTIGARKSRISPEGLQQMLVIEFPDISWAYVRFQGTLAVIEVVEKVRASMPGPGDLVARKDGVIESVLVLSGVPLVKPGQTVQKGDLLIAGIPSGSIQGARGSVTAQTWYEVLSEESLSGSKAVRTGRKKEIKILRLGHTELSLASLLSPFEWYEVEEYPIAALEKGETAPAVEIFLRVFFEVKWEWKECSVEEAIARGRAKGEHAIESRLPSSAKLIDFSYEASGDAESVLVRVIAGTIEEIGELTPWPSHENGGW